MSWEVYSVYYDFYSTAGGNGTICSMKKPLKNTCDAALSAPDLLCTDEAK